MSEVTINAEQRLFVIPCGDGYTCRGFDNLAMELNLLVGRIPLLKRFAGEVSRSVAGTLDQYALYRRLIDVLARHSYRTPTWFHPDTPVELQAILERCRENRTPVRCFFGNPKTGRDSLEEFNVTGRVGRSTGILRIPLLVPDGDCGGDSLSSERVVKLVATRSGRVLWQHAAYHIPQLALVPDESHPGITWRLDVDGQCQARYRDIGEAAEHVAFITGRTHHYRS